MSSHEYVDTRKPGQHPPQAMHIKSGGEPEHHLPPNKIVKRLSIVQIVLAILLIGSGIAIVACHGATRPNIYFYQFWGPIFYIACAVFGMMCSKGATKKNVYIFFVLALLAAVVAFASFAMGCHSASVFGRLVSACDDATQRQGWDPMERNIIDLCNTRRDFRNKLKTAFAFNLIDLLLLIGQIAIGGYDAYVAARSGLF